MVFSSVVQLQLTHSGTNIPPHRYSPLHNVHIPQDPTAHYPALMILTADHDDRVVPLHSFKFISTLQAAMGDRNDPIHCRPLLTRIETKAGHGAGKPTSKMVR